MPKSLQMTRAEGPDAQSRLFNQSLAKALAVLEAFGADRQNMTLPEIASAAGISKSAAQRLTHTLEQLGYLRKDRKLKVFSLTPKVLELGMRYTAASALITIAQPCLLDLNRESGETVNLSEPDGLNMIFVASYPGQRQIAVQLPVGGCFPIYCTAAGRAYLSGIPKPEADALLRRSDPVAHTPDTILDRAAIVALVDEARQAGYAHAQGEYYRGDINIAAPVLGGDGQAIASVSISVPLTRWTFADACARIAPQVVEVAQALSSRTATLRKS